MSPLSSTSIAVSAVTLTCSLLSTIGAGFILICYSILPLQYHFRHILILNLAVADFINALSGSIGGIYILARKRPLQPSRACTFLGFVEQITVQGTDTAILVIAIATVYTLTMSGPISNAPEQKRRYGQVMMMCVAIWALPFITSFLALGMGWYAPASGNWCWIKGKPAYLRYVLTHGWRFLFIITEICLYVFLHIRLRRHYQRLLALQYSDSIGPPANMAAMTTLKPDSKEKEGAAISQLEFRPSSSTRATVPVFGDNGSTTLLQGSQQNIPPSAASITLASVMGLRRRRSPKSLYSNPQYQAIQRVLLLNAYPLAYIILWIPGIANRLIEATGHKSTAMQILQASTQLVGLANALTYGWNERVAKQLKERFFKDR